MSFPTFVSKMVRFSLNITRFVECKRGTDLELYIATQEAKKEECKFKASMNYTVSSGPAWTIYSDYQRRGKKGIRAELYSKNKCLLYSVQTKVQAQFSIQPKSITNTLKFQHGDTCEITLKKKIANQLYRSQTDYIVLQTDIKYS